MNSLLKLFKNIIGVLLIPFVIASIPIFLMSITAGGWSWISLIFILVGGVSFVLIYFLTSKPEWLYVFGHELTHALWSLSFGGKIKKIRVTSTSGHTISTKSNFLTSLAPYFFPLYTILTMLIFAIGSLFFDWSGFVWVFYLLLGLTYTFHILMNIHILKTEQTDITKHGYIFSSAVIFIGNMTTALLGLSILSSKIGALETLQSWFSSAIQIYKNVGGFFL